MMKFFTGPENKDKDEQIAKVQDENKRLKDQIFRQQVFINMLQDDVNQKHILIMQLKRALQECATEEQLTTLRDKYIVQNEYLKENGKFEWDEKQGEIYRKRSLDSRMSEVLKTGGAFDRLSLPKKVDDDRMNKSEVASKKEVSNVQNSIGFKTPFLNKKIIPEATDNFRDELVSFDAELKNQFPNTFKEIKHFVLSKQTYCAQEIYELIDRSIDAISEAKNLQDKPGEKGRQKYEKLLECLLFEILYPRLFAMDEDHKARNTQLQDKFYVLQNIISFDMLEIPQTLRIPSLYTICEHELKKLNNYKAPSSKINCVSNCVNNLVDVYCAYEKRKPTADELFPMFVYLVLRANPDKLRSNVEFIYKYIRKSELMGESGFLVTNLEAVISFLDSVDGRSLNEGILEVKSNRAITPAF